MHVQGSMEVSFANNDGNKENGAAGTDGSGVGKDGKSVEAIFDGRTIEAEEDQMETVEGGGASTSA